MNLSFAMNGKQFRLVVAPRHRSATRPISCILESWAPCPEITPPQSPDYRGPAFPMGPPLPLQCGSDFDPAPTLKPACRMRRLLRCRHKPVSIRYLSDPRNMEELRRRLNILKALRERRQAKAEAEAKGTQVRSVEAESQAVQAEADVHTPESRIRNSLKRSRTIKSELFGG